MKKILTLLCIVTAIFSMTLQAGATEETKTYNGYTADDLKSNSEGLYTSLSGFTDEEIEQYLNSADEVTSKAVQSWVDVKDEIGDFVAIGDFEVEESKNAITTRLTVEYSKRNLILTVNYDENLTVDSILAEKDTTLGESMEKAGLNTLMGMGTVFAILILISFLISLFKYINIWEERFKNRNSLQEEVVIVPSKEEMSNSSMEVVDDLEIVAVISATIAAATNTSSDDFVVRSIKRRTTKR